MKVNWRLWVGLGLSVICLALAVQGIDLAQVGRALAGVQYPWLLPSAAAGVFCVWLKALRWRLLFFPQTGLPTGKLFSITMIGFVINSVLPARLGDPARAVLAAEMTGVRTAQALATVVVERLLDVLTLLVILMAMLPFIGIPEWLWRSAALVGVASFSAFLGLLLLGRRRERLLPLVERLARPLPFVKSRTVAEQLDHLLSGMDAFGSLTNSLSIAGYSLIVWAFSAMQIYLVQVAFALPAPPSAALLVMIVNVLGMLVPSSPGYIGVFHYLTVITLALFGIEQSLALSYAVVLHLTIFVPLVAFGVVAMWQQSLSLGRVSARASRLGQ